MERGVDLWSESGGETVLDMETDAGAALSILEELAGCVIAGIGSLVTNGCSSFSRHAASVLLTVCCKVWERAGDESGC